ncbi:glycosyl hydrolase family 65 protein [Iodidimonas sp. MBR-14]|uniref:glycoside hydrolase family 65 protein n=1 Tax=Iodidimonas sp. MBR-14 TaxID=3032319 RepID=UPI002482D7AE|nr:glycosyl hydrolase family 65 protein [Iodidimonas sp. MBR-14]
MSITKNPFLKGSPYKLDAWSLSEQGSEQGVDQANLPRSLSLFSVGNGLIGVRGGYEDALDEGDLGRALVYVNGIYETVPIHYHEKAHGFAESSDTRPPAPNATPIHLYADGERLHAGSTQLVSSSRRLDFKTGVLESHLCWKTARGAIITARYERLACLQRPGILASRVTISVKGAPADLSIHSFIEAAEAEAPARDQEKPHEGAHDPRLGPAFKQSPFIRRSAIIEGLAEGMLYQLARSGQYLAVVADHEASNGLNSFPSEARGGTDRGAEQAYKASLSDGESISLTKFICYEASPPTPQTAQLQDHARKALDHLAAAKALGFAGLLLEQADDLADFWAHADIAIDGAPEDGFALRFNMFQLLQAVGRGGDTSLCAKGQTGEGYEGHYFWDAEIFGLPMLASARPRLARDMLLYRCRTLEQSRQHAREMGHARGALIAWRTISGRECSAYFPAGSAQYHINSDVAYALKRYVDMTGDEDFLIEHGARLLFETALIWNDIGFFNPLKNNAFCINCVTGPDEYTALVNNNFYTNAMARRHLDHAYEIARWMEAKAPDAFTALAHGIGLTQDDIALWRKAADQMYLPYSENLGIHAQDDSFLDKKPWDIAGTPADKFPLLLHYHPLSLYRHQICKQADTVLAMALLGDQFDPADMTRDLDYYEGVTVHDSTLSACIFGMLSSQLGRAEKALDYFHHAVYVDLGDLHKNTGHGLHMASSGGSWMCIIEGFAGMRIKGNDALSFTPCLPEKWTALRFNLGFQNRLIAIEITPQTTQYRLLKGAPMRIYHGDQMMMLDETQEISAPTRHTVAENSGQNRGTKSP